MDPSDPLLQGACIRNNNVKNIMRIQVLQRHYLYCFAVLFVRNKKSMIMGTYSQRVIWETIGNNDTIKTVLNRTLRNVNTTQ